MAKALNNIPAVESFTVGKSNTGNLSKKWDVWKDDFTLFVVASGITNTDQKKALLLHMAGKEVKEIYRSLKTDTVDTFEEVLKGVVRVFFSIFIFHIFEFFLKKCH